MSPVAPAHSLQGSSNVSKFLWRAAKQVLIVAGLVSVAVTASWASSDQDIALSVGDVVSFDFLDDTLPAETLTIGSDGGGRPIALRLKSAAGNWLIRYDGVTAAAVAAR